MNTKSTKFIDFCDSVIHELWRFDSRRQYELISRMPKELQKKIKSKSKQLNFKVSQIERDEFLNVANLYGMSVSQYIHMLHRNFKDSVVANLTQIPSDIKDGFAIASRSKVKTPEFAKSAEKFTKDLGLPCEAEKGELRESFDKLVKDCRDNDLANF